MSEVSTKRKVKVDPQAEAYEQNRREELAQSDPYQRGIALAAATFLSNTRLEFDTAMSDLKRTALTRDQTQAGRDAYNRVQNRLEKIAARLAEITGQGVAIPEWLPPVGNTQKMVTIRPPGFDHGHYAESKGMGKSGKGGPGVPIPGSAGDWTSTK